MDDRCEKWLWLANGLGAAAHWEPLWQAYGDIEAIYDDRYALADKKLVSVKQAQRLLATSAADMTPRRALHEEKGLRILTFDGPQYPESLRQIAAPPMVLYLKGKAECLQQGLMIGIVGARHPSAYGVEATQTIARQLAQAGVTLVSGLAEGLDGEAHRAALQEGTTTIGVLGTDLETVFPAKHRTLQGLVAKSGALVSEYPCDCTGVRFKESFVQRNRIIAGLCRGLCVAEARLRSGTMSTVRFAMEDGRDVFAVPGSIFSQLSEGTNSLLKAGAKPVTCAQDILQEYGIAAPQAVTETVPPPSAKGLSGNEEALYRAMDGCLGMAQLCEKTGLAPAQVMAALTRLEMQGFIRQLPGRRFEKAI